MVDMADTKLFDDVTNKRVLNKLIPIGSPHYVQMQALVIDIIGLVPDAEIDLLCLAPRANASFRGIDCTEVIQQIIGQGRTGEWAVTYMLLIFYQAYDAVDSGSDACL